MSIGSNIKKIRKEKKITQNDLAKEMGISRSYLGDLENDRRNPSTKTLESLAQKLDVSMPYLLEGKRTMEDFEKMAMEDLKNNPVKMESILEFMNKNDSLVKNLAESALHSYDDVNFESFGIHENLFIVRAREFLDLYPPETIGLVASTIQSFNELHAVIQDNNKNASEKKQIIETEINEMIELSGVVYNSIKEALYNEIDKNK